MVIQFQTLCQILSVYALMFETYHCLFELEEYNLETSLTDNLYRRYGL
jgi:hypothetical protein